MDRRDGGPQRGCVACRVKAPKEALVRVVRTPSGEAVLDVTGKLPGRGAYVCPNVECLRRARKSGALARALKTSMPDACWEDLERCVERHAAGGGDSARELSSLIGLSRRANLVVIGADNIGPAMRKQPMLVMTARDCSDSVLRAVAPSWSLPLDVEGLSAALGARNVQAIALPARNGLTDKVKALIVKGREMRP